MKLVLAAWLVSVASCTSTPNARPHDMSVAGHESEATEHERLAQTHSAEYRPSDVIGENRCAGRACWTSQFNPTLDHLAIAEQHRKMAADHRAASQALRDAEARACIGVPQEDRDMSPFEHREDIASVERLYAAMGSPKAGTLSQRLLVGAVVTFRATPGLTAPWLQRVVDCHLARNAALGHVVPEMPTCPLVPKDVSATVSETDGRVFVEVRSDDSDIAREIVRRAEGLR